MYDFRFRQPYLWGYGQASQWISIQDVCACIVDDYVRSDLIQGSLAVQLHLLEILRVLCAPVQLHFSLNGPYKPPNPN